ncbi:hypothetical protein AAMO2058_001676500 [Amorphochlora amoebiformis]
MTPRVLILCYVACFASGSVSVVGTRTIQRSTWTPQRFRRRVHVARRAGEGERGDFSEKLKSPEAFAEKGVVSATVEKDGHVPMGGNGLTTSGIFSGKFGNRLTLAAVASLYAMVTIDLRTLALEDSAPHISILGGIRGLFIALCYLPSAVQLIQKKEIPSLRDWLVSLEMAVYNLGSQGLFAAGLYFSDATLASFLTQSSVIVTPLISLALGDQVRRSTWAGCALALVGVGLLGLDGAKGAEAAVGVGGGEINLTGPALLLGGAVCWSMYIIRYGKLLAGGQGMSAIGLQTWKSFLLSLLYLVWFAADISLSATQSHGENLDLISRLSEISPDKISEAIFSAWPGRGVPLQWLAIFFSAFGVSLAHWLQGVGQRNTSAAEANVIMSTEPLWTAVLAYVLLHESLHGLEGVFGGSLLISAGLISGGILDREPEVAGKRES